jgi:hypothetical protein
MLSVLALVSLGMAPVGDPVADHCCREPHIFPQNPDLCYAECVTTACVGTLWEIALPATCRSSPTQTCIIGPNTATLTIIEADCEQTLCIWDLTKHTCNWVWNGNEQDVEVSDCAPTSAICPPTQPPF